MPNYLPKVREQYEQLPYPPRDPSEEKVRLMGSWGDSLQYLSHYAFGGQLNPDQEFSVLVAGGGTGDSTIYWAEQLRGTNARLIHLDLSTASIDVAKQRASIRKLDNIEFISGSLLDLPKMDIGSFDHINCTGVLHHLENPVAGLKALNSVLGENGVMNIMLYGQYRRAMLYHMQSLMKKVNNPNDAIDLQLQNTKEVLGAIKTNSWGQMLQHQCQREAQACGDSGLYDMYLHPQDRAYTIPQLYEYVESCGLSLSHWVQNDHIHYNALFSMRDIKDSYLKELIAKKPEHEQQEILEMMSGDIGKHQFYASKNSLNEASIADESLIPDFTFFAPREKTMPIFASLDASKDGQKVQLGTRRDKKEIVVNEILRTLTQQIDGERSIGQIIDAAYEALRPTRPESFNREVVKKAFEDIYAEFHFSDWLLLRHPSVPRYLSHAELQDRMLSLQ